MLGIFWSKQVLCVEDLLAEFGVGASNELIDSDKLSVMFFDRLIPGYPSFSGGGRPDHPDLRVPELLPARPPTVVHGFHIKPASTVDVPQVASQIIRLVHSGEILVGWVEREIRVDELVDVRWCDQCNWNSNVVSGRLHALC